MLTHEHWHDQAALRWTMNDVSLLVLQHAGPRIVSLEVAGSPNILADVPDFTIPCPDNAPYQIWGGHRLWYAPETPDVTYLPDDQPVAISEIDNTLTIRGVPNSVMMQKTLHITVEDDHTIQINHVLTNHSKNAVTCAPWAITQLKTGGVAILPQARDAVDPAGLQANRSLALWQYTDIQHPNLMLGNRWITVRAAYGHGEAMKLGWANRVGWLAYHWQGQLFVKAAEFDPDAWYYDSNSSSECYCNDRFLELETLAPRIMLEPHASTTHRETWQVRPFMLADYREETLDAAFATLKF